MGLVSDIVGGLIQADSNRAAANTQADATRDSVAEQRRQYDLTRSDYAPWREAGQNALAQIMTEMKAPVTSADVMQDPGYQFGLTQGQNALDRKFAAAGGRVSGAAMKAASRYGTDYASSGYGAAYARRQDSLNRLQAIAGLGQTATTGTASAGANSSNNISSLISSQGDASAAARLRSGSIWGNALNKTIGSANSLASYFGG